MVEENKSKDSGKRLGILGRRRRQRAIVQPVDTVSAPPEILQPLVNEITQETQNSESKAAADGKVLAEPTDRATEQKHSNTSEQSEVDKDALTISSGNGDTETTAPVESTAQGLPKYPELKAESTTSLIFFAPELPKLPAVRVNSRENESDDTDGNKRRRNRGTSENRRNNRQEQSSGSGDEKQDRQDRKDDNGSSRTVTSVRGSTRLEAKRQRRRDNRDSSRRRQVITEVEFLARRESAERTMVVRTKSGVTEIAVLEDKILAEHYVTRQNNISIIGNVYLGRVQNVLPSMEAAFVDIGRGRNAVLYSGEVDWEGSDHKGGQRRIELALKTGDPVLVQVTKDPVGHKGARLTSQISLPGRYLVFVPNGDMNGISRKLAEPERVRLKKILKEIVPENSGVIVRTAAEGATEEQLTLDIKRLTQQWEQIQKQVADTKPPQLLHSEPDLLTKIIRDVFNEDFTKIVISGSEATETINRYLTQVAPDLLEKVERYSGRQDVFQKFRISEQIEKALDRKVWLPSGGSLVIDRTEAMTVIDVNTGKFVGSGGNLEETVTKNNLESAEEIVRQLRLRDIGGIIVIDFIDMVLESNRDMVLRRLIECLSRDRTKHQVAEVTSLGLVQMTRKKIGIGLAESFQEVQSDSSRENSDEKDDRLDRKPRSNRNRSVSNNGGGSRNDTNGQQAHEITEDVKNAVAQIVASTIANPTGQIPVQPKASDQEDGTTQSEDAQQQTKSKKTFSPEQQSEEAKDSKARAKNAAAVVLDLPLEPKIQGDGGSAAKPDLSVLDSVLNAIPSRVEAEVPVQAEGPGTAVEKVSEKTSETLSKKTSEKVAGKTSEKSLENNSAEIPNQEPKKRASRRVSRSTDGEVMQH